MSARQTQQNFRCESAMGTRTIAPHCLQRPSLPEAESGRWVMCLQRGQGTLMAIETWVRLGNHMSCPPRYVLVNRRAFPTFQTEHMTARAVGVMRIREISNGELTSQFVNSPLEISR